MTPKHLKYDEIYTWLKPRTQTDHKGLFGHVLIIGGDDGMPGAVKLAALGALKMGTGLTTVITRKAHVPIIVSNQPELLCYGLNEKQLYEFKKQLFHASIIILGPGLGASSWSKWLFNITIRHINQYKTPCLIDADGLNEVAKTNWTADLPCIFTPHPGEAARLLKLPVDEIQANRLEAVQALQKKLGGVVLLKGHHSLIATADESVSVCLAGNPAMASGGMGDLLSGIIAGLVTQGLTLWQATQFGVVLHAEAGDAALKKQGGPGLLASDLLPELKPLLNLKSL